MASLETIEEVVRDTAARVKTIEESLNNGLKIDLAVVQADTSRHRWWLRGLTVLLFGIAGYVLKASLK